MFTSIYFAFRWLCKTSRQSELSPEHHSGSARGSLQGAQPARRADDRDIGDAVRGGELRGLRGFRQSHGRMAARVFGSAQRDPFSRHPARTLLEEP